MLTSNSTLRNKKCKLMDMIKEQQRVKNKEPHGIIRLDHYWNLAHIEWIDACAKPEKHLCQPKRNTKIMELFRTTILKIYKQCWKIFPRLYALF
jgi:hypothetical protein